MRSASSCDQKKEREETVFSSLMMAQVAMSMLFVGNYSIKSSDLLLKLILCHLKLEGRTGYSVS